MSVDTILLYTIFAGILSIVYGFVTGSSILNASAGNAKMQEIASAIQIGATLSGIAGYVGMLVSVQANVRTAEASRKGLSQGLSIAFNLEQ